MVIRIHMTSDLGARAAPCDCNIGERMWDYHATEDENRGEKQPNVGVRGKTKDATLNGLDRRQRH